VLDTAPDPFEVEAARFDNLALQAIHCPASYTVVDIDPLGQGHWWRIPFKKRIQDAHNWK
jgi:hypothetical protein